MSPGCGSLDDALIPSSVSPLQEKEAALLGGAQQHGHLAFMCNFDLERSRKTQLSKRVPEPSLAPSSPGTLRSDPVKLGAAQHQCEELWNYVQAVLGWEEEKWWGLFCSSPREECCCAHPPGNGHAMSPGQSWAQNHSWSSSVATPQQAQQLLSKSSSFATRSQGSSTLLCCHPLLPDPDILPAPAAPSQHPGSPCPLPGHSRCRMAASRAPHPPAWAAT